MKKSSANTTCSLMVVAVFCLFPFSPAFSQAQGLSKASRAAELSKALKAVEESTKKHSEALADLLDKVPQEARPSIEHAIGVSKRGRNIAVEAVELARTSSPLEKALLHTTYAESRLADIQAMRSKGKPEFVETLVKDYEGAIGGAMNGINKAKAQGRNVNEALKAVERSTKKHTEVLTGLLGKVPEQAKPAIARAIEVSKRGRNRALDVLNKIQRGELPIGKPEGIGRPEGVGKPEGVGRSEGVGKPEKERGGPGGRRGSRKEEREEEREEERRGRPGDRGGRFVERRGRPSGGGGRGRGR